MAKPLPKIQNDEDTESYRKILAESIKSNMPVDLLSTIAIGIKQTAIIMGKGVSLVYDGFTKSIDKIGEYVPLVGILSDAIKSSVNILKKTGASIRAGAKTLGSGAMSVFNFVKGFGKKDDNGKSDSTKKLSESFSTFFDKFNVSKIFTENKKSITESLVQTRKEEISSQVNDNIKTEKSLVDKFNVSKIFTENKKSITESLVQDRKEESSQVNNSTKKLSESFSTFADKFNVSKIFTKNKKSITESLVQDRKGDSGQNDNEKQIIEPINTINDKLDKLNELVKIQNNLVEKQLHQQEQDSIDSLRNKDKPTDTINPNMPEAKKEKTGLGDMLASIAGGFGLFAVIAEIKAIVGGIVGAVTKAGALLVGAGKGVVAIVGGIGKAFGTIMTVGKVLLSAVGRIFPVFAIIGGIVGFLQGWSNAAETFNLPEGMDANIGQKISSAIAGIVKIFTFGLIDEKLVAQSLYDFGTQVKDKILAAFDWIKSFVDEPLGMIKTMVSSLMDGIREKITTAINGLKSFMDDPIAGMANIGTMIVNGLKGLWNSAIDGFLGALPLGVGRLIPDNLVDKIKLDIPESRPSESIVRPQSTEQMLVERANRSVSRSIETNQSVPQANTGTVVSSTQVTNYYVNGVRQRNAPQGI